MPTAFAQSISDSWILAKQILIVAVPFFLIIMLFIWRNKIKRFPIEAIIIERRDKNLIKTNDRIGRVLEDGLEKYKFALTKDTIPPVDFSYILHTMSRPTNFFDKLSAFLGGYMGTIFLYKYGSKQYKPISLITKTASESTGIIPLDATQKDSKTKGETISCQIQPINIKKEFENLEFEVIDTDDWNFKVVEQRATLERRQKKQDRLMQLLPYIMMGGVVILYIISTYLGYNFIRDAWTAGSSARNGAAAPPVDNTPAKVPIAGDLFNPGQ